MSPSYADELDSSDERTIVLSGASATGNTQAHDDSNASGNRATETTSKTPVAMETSEDETGPPAKKARLSSICEWRNQELQSALMLAVCRGREEAVDKLVSEDPSQTHRHYDRRGRNVFHYCALAAPSVAARVVATLLRLRRDGRLTQQTLCGLRAALTMPDGSWRTPVQTAAEADALGSLRVLAVLAAELQESRAVEVDAARVVRAGAERVARWLRETGRSRCLLRGRDETEGDAPGWESRVSVFDEADDPSGPGVAADAAADWESGGCESNIGDFSDENRMVSEKAEFLAALRLKCDEESKPAVGLLELVEDPAASSRWVLGAGWSRETPDDMLEDREVACAR